MFINVFCSIVYTKTARVPLISNGKALPPNDLIKPVVSGSS